MTGLTAPPRILAYRQPGVEFFEADHRYTFRGEPVLNVTTINREHKISADWRQVPPELLERKRQIGKAAHAAAHYYDEGDLVDGSVDPLVQPYLDGWIRFRAETDFEPLLLETALVHPLLRVAGTLDRFGICWKLHRTGRPSIVDLKTGDPDDAGAGPQTAAYEQNVRAVLTPQELGISVAEWNAPWTRYSVQLLPNGRYKLCTYTNPRDLHRFNWAASLEASAHPSWRRP